MGTNGTTRMTTNGEPRLGARTAMSTVPLPSVRPPPLVTTTCTEDPTLLPAPPPPPNTDPSPQLVTANTDMENPTPPLRLLRLPPPSRDTEATAMPRPPATTPPPVPATTTTSGPSRPMAAT